MAVLYFILLAVMLMAVVRIGGKVANGKQRVHFSTGVMSRRSSTRI